MFFHHLVWIRHYKLTSGMSKAQSSPPSLQLIWRAIFCVTLRSLFCCEIVLALITWGLKKIVKNLTWQDIKTYKTQQWNLLCQEAWIVLLKNYLFTSSSQSHYTILTLITNWKRVKGSCNLFQHFPTVKEKRGKRNEKNNCSGHK